MKMSIWHILVGESPSGQLPIYIRAFFGVVAISLFIASLWASHHSDLYPSILVVCSAAFLLQAATGMPIDRLKFGDNEVSARQPTRDTSTGAAMAGDNSVGGIDSDDEGLPTESADDDNVIAYLNFAAAQQAISAIIHNASTADAELEGMDIRLYLHDQETEQLVQTVGSSPAESWAIGQGATGLAFKKRDFVCVTGDRVWNADYGISELDAEKYRDLTAVAAVPVRNRQGHPFGVVTAADRNSDSTLKTDDGKNALVVISLLISRVFIELLHWAEEI